jgi:hypothetical protein
LKNPGITPYTDIGKGQQPTVGKFIEAILKGLVNLFGNSIDDSAKTQVWLSASPEVANRGSSGCFWGPVWKGWWTRTYDGSRQEELTALGKDEEERKKLWVWTNDVLQRLTGEGRSA